MCLDPAPLGLEERTSIEDLWALWDVFSEGPRKLASWLASGAIREPRARPRPDRSAWPRNRSRPGDEAVEAYVSEPMSSAEISARRRFEVRLWTGEVIDERGGPRR